MENEPRSSITQPEQSGALERFVRLTWKVLGNFLLFIMLILIVIATPGARSVLDVLFWLVVAALILVRFIDINVFKGRSADNEPATLKDWRRYSIGLVLLAGFFWVIAHAIVTRGQ